MQIPGNPPVEAVVLEGSGSSSSKRYLALCSTPPDLESTILAYQTFGEVEVATAKKVKTLASGLSLFSFTSTSSLIIKPAGKPGENETFHAIEITAEGILNDEEQGVLSAELKYLEAKRVEKLKAASGSLSATSSDLRELLSRITNVKNRQNFPLQKIQLKEVASERTKDALERAAATFERTMIATSAGEIRAIRHDGNWLDVREASAVDSDQLESVTLRVSGSQQGIRVNCELACSSPMNSSAYSMVIATTSGLEGEGTISDKLAKVKPVSFSGAVGTHKIYQNLKWDLKKTTLWLKVFCDKEPEKMLLDEQILVDYQESFSARWGKPPSSLIKRPTPEPDVPADLVQETQVLDAKGEIMDMVAAADGSILMIQTDRPPFWSPLDLRTGKWVETPWKASNNTLLATQAGKIYLLDRITRILEIWDWSLHKREGTQLLPLADPIVAFTAPLSASHMPVLVTTEKGAFFLDSKKFDVISNGLNADSIFTGQEYERLQTSTLWLRASDDGVYYSMAGSPLTLTNAKGGLAFTLDRSGLVIDSRSEVKNLTSRGRRFCTHLPDHGGKGFEIAPSSSNDYFPYPTGRLRFLARNSKEIASIKNPPALPKSGGKQSGPLRPDRRVYFDSSIGALLLPDHDKLHFLRIKLPEPTWEQQPDFELKFPDEHVELRLPPGKEHALTVAEGTKVFGPDSVKWTVPTDTLSDGAVLTLSWTDESGAKKTEKFHVDTAVPQQEPIAESSDGKKSFTLIRRGVLSTEAEDIRGFAGTGHIALCNDSGVASAWNLATCERIFDNLKATKMLFGDAGHLYTFQSTGTLTSFDIQTGKQIAEVMLGGDVFTISTGISSMGPLLAVEREGFKGFLTEISRDTLKSNLVDISAETQQKLSNLLRSNASGTVVWSGGNLLLREGKLLTIKPFTERYMEDLNPDASGRWLVGASKLVDLSTVPPVETSVTNLPGVSSPANFSRDESGHYILVYSDSPKSRIRTASVRSLQDPSKELFKLRLSLSSENPRFISETRTLVHRIPALSTNRRTGVYEFDIPEIVQKLAH